MNAAALLAVCALLASPLYSATSPADPTKKPASTSKRPKNTNAHARQAVVTRKKVNGRWVRVTSVHSNPAPSYQIHPDSDRYQQIQQALANSGYFKGMVDGKWGDDSVAALKQFQTDRNIPNV